MDALQQSRMNFWIFWELLERKSLLKLFYRVVTLWKLIICDGFLLIHEEPNSRDVKFDIELFEQIHTIEVHFFEAAAVKENFTNLCNMSFTSLLLLLGRVTLRNFRKLKYFLYYNKLSSFESRKSFLYISLTGVMIFYEVSITLIISFTWTKQYIQLFCLHTLHIISLVEP